MTPKGNKMSNQIGFIKTDSKKCSYQATHFFHQGEKNDILSKPKATKLYILCLKSRHSISGHLLAVKC